MPSARTSAELVDGEGRALRYLRLSITDRCDMACTYCMPPEGEREHGLREDLLSFEEITRLVQLLAKHGLRRVRLTGGEPLVRRDAVSLVARIREVGIDDVWMTTNGARLASVAHALSGAGLVGVNVSIDSLDAARFARVTRGGQLSAVLEGLEEAGRAGLALRTNTVVLRSENLGELVGLARWAWSIGATPRFIELMPIGEGASLLHERVGVEELRATLAPLELVGAPSHDAGRGPARYLMQRGEPRRRVGFITAVSDEFCAGCNRVRMTAQGELRPCLATRRAVSLRELLRGGASDAELLWALQWALATKTSGHRFRDDTLSGTSMGPDHRRVGMSLIGG